MKEVQGNFPKGTCNPVEQVKLLLWKKKKLCSIRRYDWVRDSRGAGVIRKGFTEGRDIFWVLKDCPDLGGWRENVQGRRTKVRMALEVGVGIDMLLQTSHSQREAPAAAVGQNVSCSP